MGSDDEIFILVCSFAAFGVAINLLSLVIHVALPKLLKHPGSLILVHLFCQIVVLTHWFTVYPKEIL
jgi:hypothetical protein